MGANCLFFIIVAAGTAADAAAVTAATAANAGQRTAKLWVAIETSYALGWNRYLKNWHQEHDCSSDLFVPCCCSTLVGIETREID